MDNNSIEVEMKKIILFVVFLLMLTCSVGAETTLTFYTDITLGRCNDNGPGTVNNPWCNPPCSNDWAGSPVADVLTPGDRVKIASTATYNVEPGWLTLDEGCGGILFDGSTWPTRGSKTLLIMRLVYLPLGRQRQLE